MNCSRPLIPRIGLLLALLVTAVPADAATQTVVTSSNVFTPADVTVTQGDSVTWSNSGGFHNARATGPLQSAESS